MYKYFLKRAIDLILSALGIIILSPLFIAIIIIIKIDSPGPAFFSQNRVGIHKTHFVLYKFRTMRTDTPHDMPTHLLHDPEQYITRIGGFLRTSSLDELPQLFNILTGKVSIIGPRPALWNQYDLIAERDKYGANDIRPGLSGWAQINGRDTIEIPDKARYDGEYAANVTFKMDWKCFWGTVVNVLTRSGVVEGGTGELTRARVKDEKSL